MADIVTTKERSENMARIRLKDTKPEVFIRRKLFAKGYRFRKNVNYLPGHPDIWMKKYNLAIFVNGCFWHRHKNCKLAYIPKSREAFWNRKFEENLVRDNKTKDELLGKHIRMLVIWECTIRQMARRNDEEVKEFHRIESFIHSNEEYAEL